MLSWTSVTTRSQSNLIAVVKFKFERMFVFGLIFQFLCQMPQRNWIFFILFVALSYCDKICIVCCTGSLRQTDFLFVALSHCDKLNFYLFQKKCQNIPKMQEKNTKNAQQGHARHIQYKKMPKSFKKFSIFGPFWHFFLLQHILILFVTVTQCNQQQNLFVAVTQCNTQNKSLSQWLIPTNNIGKISNFFAPCDKRIGKKKKKIFHIWISPPLSNCFGVPLKSVREKKCFIIYPWCMNHLRFCVYSIYIL